MRPDQAQGLQPLGFFFAPQAPTPIALFRAIYGGMVIITILMLRPDWLTWYGTHAWVSLRTMQQMEPGTRLSLRAVHGHSE